MQIFERDLTSHIRNLAVCGIAAILVVFSEIKDAKIATEDTQDLSLPAAVFGIDKSSPIVLSNTSS
jgi:hypothetical protein